ncbi:MAG: hypothetical protein WBC20_06855 [Candidatus Aminicenantaceae bacterium]
MDRYFILAGLFFNLVGVLLIFFGARRYIKIGEQTSSRDTGYLTIFHPPWFLPLGLILVIVGIIFQMVGIFIN